MIPQNSGIGGWVVNLWGGLRNLLKKDILQCHRKAHEWEKKGRAEVLCKMGTPCFSPIVNREGEFPEEEGRVQHGKGRRVCYLIIKAHIAGNRVLSREKRSLQ